jgi:hypothetical protein
MHRIYDRLLHSAQLTTLSDLVPYIKIPARLSILKPSSWYLLHLTVIHSHSTSQIRGNTSCHLPSSQQIPLARRTPHALIRQYQTLRALVFQSSNPHQDHSSCLITTSVDPASPFHSARNIFASPQRHHRSLQSLCLTIL